MVMVIPYSGPVSVHMYRWVGGVCREACQPECHEVCHGRTTFCPLPATLHCLVQVVLKHSPRNVPAMINLAGHHVHLGKQAECM